MLARRGLAFQCTTTSVSRAIALRESIRLRQHFFDDPVRQPLRKGPRIADLTGLKLWSSAKPMLHHMESDVLPALRGALASPRPLRVLELGSGCGFLGIGLAALGETVVLTDPAIPVNFEHEEEDGARSSLDWLQSNIDLNRELVGERAVARQLAWGDPQHEAAIRREWSGEDGFDLIVGSDLLYNPDEYEGLLHTLRAFCAADRHPPALLVYPPRHPGEQRFFDSASHDFRLRRRTIQGRAGENGASLVELNQMGAAETR